MSLLMSMKTTADPVTITLPRKHAEALCDWLRERLAELRYDGEYMRVEHPGAMTAMRSVLRQVKPVTQGAPEPSPGRTLSLLQEAARVPGSIVVMRTHAQVARWRTEFPGVRFLVLTRSLERLRGVRARVFVDHDCYNLTAPFEWTKFDALVKRASGEQ
jgi:hypothetical protein